MRSIDNRTCDSSRKTAGLEEEDLYDEDDKGKCLLSFTSPYPDQFSITWNLFTIDEESSSDEYSASIEGGEAVESDNEMESEEPMDDIQKLEYWAKEHVEHYRSRLLPDHVRVAFMQPTHRRDKTCNGL